MMLLALAASSCENKDIGTNCVRGKVIMSSCCTGTTFINLESWRQLGKKTVINGQSYNNVIQVPNYYNSGDIYLDLRSYVASKDSELFPSTRCYCLVAIGLDVPIYVATAFSYSGCPSAN